MSNKIQRKEQFTPEELNPLIETMRKIESIKRDMRELGKDMRIAELEHKVILHNLFLQNGISPNCQLNIQDGKVTWPDEVTEATEVEEQK